METPYHFINIFKTVLKTTPPEVLVVQRSSSRVLEIFKEVLQMLGYAASIIGPILTIVDILWKVYQAIVGYSSGQPALEYKED